MKHMKKLASLLLVLVMVLALTAPAYAVRETGSITVDNPQNGQTYTAYKIFDVTYDKNEDGTAGEHYAYTIDGGSKWFATVNAYATEANGLTLEQVTGTTTYLVSKTDAFRAANFAATLKAKVVGDTADAEIAATGKALELTPAGDKAVIENLELGYYFVTSTSGALCNLTTTNADVTIHDKNDVPFDKVDDKESVEIGETVSYTVSGKVPDTTGFTTYDYVITDKMSTGLTFNKESLQIWLSDNDTLETDTDTQLDAAYYTKTDTGAKSFDGTTDVDFNISFKALEMNGATPSLVGKYIFVTYTATVNAEAIATTARNEATLIYSNDPLHADRHGKITKEQTVYSAKLVIDKYAANPENAEDKSTKLADAAFVLYRYALPTTEGAVTTYSYAKEDGTAYTAADAAAEGSGLVKLYYRYTGDETTTAAAVTWDAAKGNATTKTTDTNGAANFNGLEDGTYYLEETAAPAGYNLLKEPVEVVINGANTEAADPLTQTASVANNTGSILPSTGGIGTTIFYVIGSILLVGAAVLLVVKKRMSAEK